MKFTSIVEAVAYYSRVKPDKICLIDADSKAKCTYREFWNRCLYFKDTLIMGGLQKGARVLVRVGPLIETFIAQFGIYLAGGVYCPVEKHIKHLKLIEMINYFDAAFVVSTEKPKCDCKYISLTEAFKNKMVYPDEFIDYSLPGPESSAAIIFTTGTTGKAKGVVLDFKSIYIFAKDWAYAYGIEEYDNFLWVNPLDRAGGVRLAGIPFIKGGTAIYCSNFIFSKEFFLSIEYYRVTAISLQSSAMSIILKNSFAQLTKYKEQIRILSVGGSFVSDYMKDRLRTLLPETRLFIHYGTTEMSPISYFEFSHYSNKVNCVGVPFPNAEIFLVDNNGQVMQDSSKDHLGNIACRSKATMSGYWNDREMTEKVLLNNEIFVSTDMGYVDKEGFIYLMGRSDDVIVCGGYKIAPYEIENIVLQMEGVDEAACVAIPDKDLEYIPRLFIKMHTNANFNKKDIFNFISQRLETFKVPRSICEIAEFPRAGNTHKIDRKELITYD